LERGTERGVFLPQLGEFAEQRSQVLLEFLQGQSLRDVLGAVPVEGGHGDHDGSLRPGGIRGIMEA
jgi:tRNA A-37 threonylcarbamoyl transferase component Bud32